MEKIAELRTEINSVMETGIACLSGDLLEDFEMEQYLDKLAHIADTFFEIMIDQENERREIINKLDKILNTIEKD